MQNQEQRPRVTVEDLLRLKRAERPSAEFWTGFERELRQKQLAALLDKRPWWRELPRWAARHAYLPMGAAAALAFAFITIRNQGTSPLAIGETVVPPAPARESTPVSPAIPSPAEAGRVEVDVSELAVNISPEPEPVAIATTVPGNVGAMIPWSAPPTIDTPSARSIAETLARLEQEAPELLEQIRSNRLAPTTALRTGSMGERAAVELASVSVDSPPGRRSNRLLAGYQERDFTPEPSAPHQVRERIARRLGDSDLFDEVRRVDLRGDRLSLKL